jgi:NitT/TauT family transport system substrate-binding protein
MTPRSYGARVVLAALLIAALALTGCSGGTDDTKKSDTTAEVKAAPVKIGTLPTEDSLPLWVAKDMGYFAVEGIDSIEIVTFQSAQERDAALAAGAIDAFMGDIIASANLEAGGTPNTIKTIMLGADQSQGRFGVVVPPKSTVTSLEQLKGVPVGTSSATIQEYVLDGLMAEAGVSEADVKVEEVKKVPVRFELLMAGKLKAAALPVPFLSLAEQGKARIVGDDTKAAKNLSQTVLLFTDKYLSTPEGDKSADGVLAAWDAAVQQINADPDSYRDELVKYARLPESLAKTYKVNTYPLSNPPAETDVNAVLDWMLEKGYLKGDVSYDDLITGP